MGLVHPSKKHSELAYTIEEIKDKPVELTKFNAEVDKKVKGLEPLTDDDRSVFRGVIRQQAFLWTGFWAATLILWFKKSRIPLWVKITGPLALGSLLGAATMGKFIETPLLMGVEPYLSQNPSIKRAVQLKIQGELAEK